jgi:hypothetical protein
MTTEELKAVKSLRLSKDNRTIQADKSNCTVVFDEFKYKENLNTLLESGVYEPLPKGPVVKVESKIHKFLSEHRTTLSIDLKHKLTLHHSKPPHL